MRTPHWMADAKFNMCNGPELSDAREKGSHASTVI